MFFIYRLHHFLKFYFLQHIFNFIFILVSHQVQFLLSCLRTYQILLQLSRHLNHFKRIKIFPNKTISILCEFIKFLYNNDILILPVIENFFTSLIFILIHSLKKFWKAKLDFYLFNFNK